MEVAMKHDDGLLDLLASIKETFWREHRRQGIADAEIRQLWGQQYVDRLAPVLSRDTPLSIRNSSSVTYGKIDGSIVTQAVALPQSQCMSRSQTMSVQACSAPTESTTPRFSRKRASSIAITTTLNTTAHPFRLPAGPGDQDLESSFPGRKMQRTASGGRTLPSVSEGLVFEDPVEYLEKAGIGSYKVQQSSNDIYPSFSTEAPIAIHEGSTQASSLSCSFNQSVPLTPDADTMQNDAYFVLPMSRQESLGADFRSGFAMFRLDSQPSDSSEFAAVPEANFIDPVYQSPCSTYRPAQSEALPLPNSPPRYATLEPSTSSYMISGPSGATTMPLYGLSSRNIKSISRRKSEYESQPQHTERILKPKMQHADDKLPPHGSHRIIRVESETRVADKCQISKTPYNRPSKQKIKCPYCEKQPEGFRGDHELRRHQKLHHSNIRIGWICLDISPDGSMLSGCKHCRSQKVYGAYYNAAAHLRRVHFHPRKEGRKARGCASRGGKGGGDDPPMEELKRWMKQVEVTEDSPHSFQIPDDSELSSEDLDQTTTDGSLQTRSNPPFSMEYLPIHGFDNTSIDAANFTLASSGYPWPSDDAWSGFRQISALEEADIFGLELHCEV